MEIHIGKQSIMEARKKKIGHLKPFVMKPNWEPIERVRETAQNDPGLYMLAFDKPVKYDKGISRVIYIGSAIKLRARLRSHYKNIKAGRDNIHFLHYVTKGVLDKIFACYFEVYVESKDEILTVEQIAFDEFTLKFGVQPLANWNPKTTMLVGEIILDGQLNPPERQKNILKHVEDDSGKYALSFDEIAEKYGLEYKRDEYDPRIMFYLKGTLERFEKSAKEKDVEKLTLISAHHVACWNKDKILNLIKIAMNLKEDQNKRLKVTKRFISDTPEVPKPHTWGEVSLILARYLAGTWYPKKRINIEIKHKNELLGKGWLHDTGRIERAGCGGCDILNVPQRNIRRKLWLEQFDNIDNKAEKMAWEYHNEGKELPKDAIGRIVEYPDFYAFRLFDWVKDQREVEFREHPEKTFKSALSEIG